LNKLLWFLRPGFLKDLLFKARLVLALVRDRRVSFLLKLIPLGVLAYTVLPDFLPLPFDDLAVIVLGTTVFLRLCPQPVVQEHTSRLNQAGATA
jgi:uncharacterized membrane protein YkvA (DUF1232 family)